jgi:group I intron endonuclease
MIRNKLNEKIYIGQTTQPIKERLGQHRRKSSGCSAIYDAIKKHGWENFEKDWYECPDEDLNFDEELMEEMLGTLAPNGYNLRKGGGSHGKMSDETKQKMRKSHLGKILSDEHIKNISGENNHCYGKFGKDNPNFGRKASEKTKETQSENNANNQRVYQYDLDGTFIDTFRSGKEAARHMKGDGTSGTLISACARGVRKRKTAYKFKWSYTFPFM